MIALPAVRDVETAALLRLAEPRTTTYVVRVPGASVLWKAKPQVDVVPVDAALGERILRGLRAIPGDGT
jgi:hypothetical protein